MASSYSSTAFVSQERNENEVSISNDETELDNLPATFPFPYEPYSIQLEFMRQLYKTLDKGKLGIFESPTGTGKSLSIICATLTWLHDFEKKKRQDLENAIKEAEKTEMEENAQQSIDSNWFESFIAKKKVSDKLLELRTEYGKYQKLDKKIKEIREKTSKKSQVILEERDAVDELYEGFKAVKDALSVEMGDTSRDEDFILKEYVSDEENASALSDEDDKDELQDRITKVYFCSRTHTQLSQFAKEVRKSPYAKDVRLVSLGSRQNFCVNDDVRKLKSLNVINDRCRELQKNKAKGIGTNVSIDGEVLKKKKSMASCPYYRQTYIQNLSEITLADVKDIEELVKIGHSLKACPYYASRYAQQLAQLVLLPYNTLLHKQTREASGIRLKGNVVIVDEAHNLLDAISSVHSSYVTGLQLSGALSQLSRYKDRYSTRLKAKNLLYIQQIVFILKALLKCLRGLNESESIAASEFRSQDNVKILKLNDFVLGLRIDNINLFKILNYCQKSQIATKLSGFSMLYQPTVKKTYSSVAAVSKSSVSAFLEKLSAGPTVDATHIAETVVEHQIATSPMMQVVEFFRCLTNDDDNGRIIKTQCLTLEKSSFKYNLLNPAAHFQDIVSSARAVIVAGGTMQPVEEFSERLFQMAGAKKERIVHFSCGHIIPSNNLLAVSLSQGPSGHELNFSYQNRNCISLIAELGNVLTNICNIIPGGIVCFFPSYDYGTKVLSQWEEKNVLSKIGIKKKVFKEPRKASETSNVLTDFSKCILSTNNANRTGAILFCVVGGKMSEGINFSDDLGRCIIMVGMPYPNIKSPELQEKMQYLNSTVTISNCDQPAGQTYYENLCMKAVNQSIGRAIRHKDDYATILLLDTRYSKPSVQGALPGWIRTHFTTCLKFGSAFGSIRKFFIDKNIKKS